MSEENKRIARRAFEELWGGGRVELIEELIAPDCIAHDVAMPEPNRGHEGARRTVELYRAAFPDLTFTIDDQIAEGDRVCTQWTARGTHEGDLMGISPTHLQATVTGMTIDRLRDGRIVESYTNWDTLGLMTQLGVVSLPTPVAAKA